MKKELKLTGKELKEMFSYNNKTQNTVWEVFKNIENTYPINITDPNNGYNHMPLIKDDEIVTIKEKDLAITEKKGIRGEIFKSTFLALYMLYLSYQNDLFIGPGKSDECIRLMLSSYFDEKWNRIPCIKLNAYQKNGYVNEPLFINKSDVDKIIKYLNRIKKHLE